MNKAQTLLALIVSLTLIISCPVSSTPTNVYNWYLDEELLQAVAEENKDNVIKYLKMSASVEGENTFTWYTPLHLAIMQGNLEIVQTLIQWNANVNAKDMLGKTPLIIATEKRYREIVDILLTRNAVINEIDKMNQTALDYARKRNYQDKRNRTRAKNKRVIARILKEKGAVSSKKII